MFFCQARARTDDAAAWSKSSKGWGRTGQRAVNCARRREATGAAIRACCSGDAEPDACMHGARQHELPRPLVAGQSRPSPRPWGKACAYTVFCARVCV